MTTTFPSCSVDIAVVEGDADLLRVSAEFREMPDLVVTIAQASRLFGVDHAHSRRILDTLVNRGILSTDGRQFASAAEDKLRVELTGSGEVVDFTFPEGGGPAESLEYNGFTMRRVEP